MSDVGEATAGREVVNEKTGFLPAGVDWSVFAISGGFVVAFVVMALIDIDGLS